MNLKFTELHWLLNYRSPLKLEYKVMMYNSLIKPIWMYGIQLWGSAKYSNIELIQRAQSKILRKITGAPWYIRNENLHNDLQVPLVREVFSNVKQKYLQKLTNHPNELAKALTNTTNVSRLRRNDLPTV